MTLPELWFIAVAVLFTGYFVLEGFDFGVGMLFPVLGRTDNRRRVLLNTIGPVWDGNEVWLITAVGAMFAAFPAWYATMFSGFYLLMLLILVSLIVRVVSIEWRGKINDPAWRRLCDAGIMTGSFVPSFLWGVIFSNIVAGLAIDKTGYVTSGFSDLFNAYAVLGGLTTLALFLLHGTVFVALKSAGDVSIDARLLVRRFGVLPVAFVAAFSVWTQIEFGKSWTLIVAGGVVGALLAAWVLAAIERDGWAFAFTTLSVAGLGVLLFGSLFPNVLPSTIDPEFTLTIANAASSHYTLKIVGWLALIFGPIVLLYQGWTYWVFRKRIAVEHIPPSIGLSLRR
ncbi:cytochrome d ubiquinol oxidase subunit II [Smaragdicoccus niigatensis]|uniref:cytochrome d ubiquinol oxidase subunit II n=1 Tax=Smaragdicoccus niigatensis TaxID=359359 RepID=UPI00039D7B77|nr:cytochrome d ubiquinol oxidase subunit II [Smaragdicoccus niigatensis]